MHGSCCGNVTRRIEREGGCVCAWGGGGGSHTARASHREGGKCGGRKSSSAIRHNENLTSRRRTHLTTHRPAPAYRHLALTVYQPRFNGE